MYQYIDYTVVKLCICSNATNIIFNKIDGRHRNKLLTIKQDGCFVKHDTVIKRWSRYHSNWRFVILSVIRKGRYNLTSMFTPNIWQFTPFMNYKSRCSCSDLFLADTIDPNLKVHITGIYDRFCLIWLCSNTHKFLHSKRSASTICLLKAEYTQWCW